MQFTEHICGVTHRQNILTLCLYLLLTDRRNICDIMFLLFLTDRWNICDRIGQNVRKIISHKHTNSNFIYIDKYFFLYSEGHFYPSSSSSISL